MEFVWRFKLVKDKCDVAWLEEHPIFTIFFKELQNGVLMWAQIMCPQVFLNPFKPLRVDFDLCLSIQKDKKSETLVFEWWSSED